MKHQKTIDNIARGIFSRSKLIKLRENALALVHRGDVDAASVIAAIDVATPTDKTIVFMGFCPGATLENRLDLDWKEKGICTFIFLQSEPQLDRFNHILAGDLVVLKKRQEFGKTMRLYGHGRVTGIKHDQDNERYLEMDWSSQDQQIEVPLMACNSTVDVRTIERVEADMPEEFFSWLNQPAAIAS
ncbi:MAG: hypothetical protein ABIQ36_12345 [Rhodanobacter sp.]